MNVFLRETRKILLNKLPERFCFVIGNESCDLDSAVCTLSLAYYYENNKIRIPSQPKIAHVVPLFNIKREELPLKTEVMYYLKKNHIDYDSITFKDDLNESVINNNDIILVDHHFSPYSPIAVYDHRPFDKNSKLPKECELQLELVGSCATLIADIVLKDENVCEYREELKMLYAATVLDTVNFSKEADRARKKDFDVSRHIEAVLEISNPDEYRNTLFGDLVEARADISHLNSYQILFKDMKLISSAQNNTIKVALPGFPMLVRDYVQLENAKESIEKFANVHSCQVIILIGMKVVPNSVQRDIGVININNQSLFKNIIENLNKGSFDLHEYHDVTMHRGKYFNQKNIRASRKQILPLVKYIIDQL